MHERERREEPPAPVRRRSEERARRADDGTGRTAGNQALGQLLDADGAAVPPEVLARMQPQLGADFGQVRVHTGSDASVAAEAIDAVAFTRGEDVVLGAGAPSSSTAAGQELLAHELTHVVQQRRATHVVDGVSQPGDVAEHAAAARDPAPGGAVHAVQRETKPEGSTVTREEVEHVLGGYLAELLHKQRRPSLEFTPELLDAITTLLDGNRLLATSIADSMKGRAPADVAKYVAGKVPATIEEARIAKIRGAPRVVAPMDTPKTFTDATLGRFVDYVVRPILKGLPQDTQDKVVRIVKDAAAAGSVAALKAGLNKAGLSGPSLDGVVKAFESALTQEPGATTDRQQEGPGSPRSTKEISPSVAPEPPKAPGEEAGKTPSVPFQEPGVKPPPDRPAPEVRVDLAAERVAAAVDPNLLVPPGTSEQQIGSYRRGPVWALEAAQRLAQAHRDKDGTVRIELGAPYDAQAATQVFDRAQQAVYQLRDALPHHCPTVRSVVLLANGQPVRSFPLHSSP